MSENDLSVIKAACTKRKVNDIDKFKIVSDISNKMQNRFQCSTIDGVKAYFDNGAWGLVRASNTSPVITMKTEASTSKHEKEVMDTIKSYVTESINEFKNKDSTDFITND